jgi:hypothetical protein
MHGTFLSNQRYKAPETCSIHGDPLVHDPIVETLLYKAGDPEPLSLQAVVDRCPTCYPTVEALMKMCVPNFMRKLAAVTKGAAFKAEKMVIVWKDGRRNEYRITEG